MTTEQSWNELRCFVIEYGQSQITKAFDIVSKAYEVNNKKADKWDSLDKKISAFYPDHEDEAETVGDLTDIGEVASLAFGYM